MARKPSAALRIALELFDVDFHLERPFVPGPPRIRLSARSPLIGRARLAVAQNVAIIREAPMVQDAPATLIAPAGMKRSRHVGIDGTWWCKPLRDRAPRPVAVDKKRPEDRATARVLRPTL